MTDEEAIRLYNMMEKEYGDKLPNPIHEPIRFAYYVKLFRYFHLRQ